MFCQRIDCFVRCRDSSIRQLIIPGISSTEQSSASSPFHLRFIQSSRVASEELAPALMQPVIVQETEDKDG